MILCESYNSYTELNETQHTHFYVHYFHSSLKSEKREEDKYTNIINVFIAHWKEALNYIQLFLCFYIFFFSETQFYVVTWIKGLFIFNHIKTLECKKFEVFNSWQKFRIRDQRHMSINLTVWLQFFLFPSWDIFMGWLLFMIFCVKLNVFIKKKNQFII